MSYAQLFMLAWLIVPLCSRAELPPSAPSGSPRLSTMDDLMTREVERRRAGHARLSVELTTAEKLFQDGEWEAAQRKFLSVLSEAVEGSETSHFRKQARQGISKCLVAQAIQKETEGQLDQAGSLLRQARQMDPDNPALAREEAQWQERNQRRTHPYSDNPAFTEDLVRKTERIRQLLNKAEQLEETGQLLAAREALDEVLSIDRYHRVALAKIEKLEDRMLRTASKKYETTRIKALAKVSDIWEKPVAPSKKEPTSQSTKSAQQTGVVATKNKLRTIKIPEVIFNERPIRSAIEELQALSIRWDTQSPEKTKGLDLVLQLPPARDGFDPEAATVNLEARDLTLEKILDYVRETVRGGVKFRIEPQPNNVVMVLPISGVSESLETRVFDLPPSLVANLNTPESDPLAVAKLVLANLGVNTEIENSKAVLFRETAKLVVRTTPSELTKIELGIRNAGADDSVELYEIETKFLQFTDNDVKNFTANLSVQMYQNNLIPQSGSYNPVPAGQNFSPSIPGLNLPSGGGGTSGLRGTTGLNANGVSVVALQNLLDPSYPQLASNQVGLNYQVFGRGVSFVLQLLQNAIGKDLVAAPRVTVADGKTSKITIARRMYYPTSYTQPTVPSNDQGIGAGFILPSNPTGFEFADVGVSLELTAKSTVNPGTVDLEFEKLLVEDFEGFIDYGATINTVTFGDSPFISGTAFTDPPISVPVSQAPYLVPIFSKRALDTKIRLEDGQTVAMGGLLAESVQLVDDSVPGLGDVPLVGRLFRSEASQKIKSNLVVFCTVRIIGPDGSPLYEKRDTQSASFTAVTAP